MADKMAIKETNVTTVHEEDKMFIRALTSLPTEKKILVKGILIGMDLQEGQEAVETVWEGAGMGKKKRTKRLAASGRKQPVLEKELSYLKECAESSVIAAFAGHKLSKLQ